MYFRKLQELKKELENVELEVSATLLITVTRSKRSRFFICAVIYLCWNISGSQPPNSILNDLLSDALKCNLSDALANYLF